MKELIYHRSYLSALNYYANSTLIVDGDYQATFADHGDRVLRLCRAMKETLKLKKEDRFAVLAVNSHQYVELYHAAFLGASIINPLNLRLAPKELNYIIRDCDAKIVFVDQFFAKLLHEARQAEAGSPIEHIVMIGEGDGPHDIKYEEMIAAAEPELPPETEEDDIAVLMYTGGTTGLPKGVVTTQRAQMLNCYHFQMGDTHFAQDDVTLIQTPIFHAASIVATIGTPVSGAKLVTVPMFDPALVLDVIERHKVTSTVMVPTMVGMMLNDPHYDPKKLASMRALVYGASPMPEAVLNRLMSDLPNTALLQGYGMTEVCSLLTLLSGDDHFAGNPRLRSVGRAVPGAEISIQNEDGEILPTGEIGEVCARTGNLMREYWNKKEATQEAFRGGWYHSGDAGYLDEDGYLFLVDRVKDMIISGGENIYSSEVESAISTHPDVLQVAVIGIPDDKWGEAVHAVIVPRESAAPDEQAIIDHARASIASYKVPKSVSFRKDPLPLSGAMKVLKRELRAPFWEGRDKSIA